MPRRPGLFPGIVLILLATACSGSGGPAPSPSPSLVASPLPTSPIGAGNAPWALDLDFSGDLAAHVTGTAPSDDAIHDECTGPESARLGSWASTMAVTIGGARYALVVIVKDYRGAGQFSSGVNVEVASEDQSKVWQNQADDSVSFTVGPGQESGQLAATLSNAAATSQKLTVSGHWSCQP